MPDWLPMYLKPEQKKIYFTPITILFKVYPCLKTFYNLAGMSEEDLCMRINFELFSSKIVKHCFEWCWGFVFIRASRMARTKGVFLPGSIKMKACHALKN